MKVVKQVPKRYNYDSSFTLSEIFSKDMDLILDFKDCGSIDSSGIGEILFLRKLCNSIKCINIKDNIVASALKMTKVDKIIDMEFL